MLKVSYLWFICGLMISDNQDTLFVSRVTFPGNRKTPGNFFREQTSHHRPHHNVALGMSGWESKSISFFKRSRQASQNRPSLRTEDEPLRSFLKRESQRSCQRSAWIMQYNFWRESNGKILLGVLRAPLVMGMALDLTWVPDSLSHPSSLLP